MMDEGKLLHKILNQPEHMAGHYYVKKEEFEALVEMQDGWVSENKRLNKMLDKCQAELRQAEKEIATLNRRLVVMHKEGHANTPLSLMWTWATSQ